jgi:hypothetical protein
MHARAVQGQCGADTTRRQKSPPPPSRALPQHRLSTKVRNFLDTTFQHDRLAVSSVKICRLTLMARCKARDLLLPPDGAPPRRQGCLRPRRIFRRRQECRRSLTAAPSASAAVSSRHRTVATSDGLGVLPKKWTRVPGEMRRPQARRAGRREHVPALPHHHHQRREIRHQRLRLRTAHQFRDPHPGGQDAVPGGVPFDTRPPANGLEGTRCKKN